MKTAKKIHVEYAHPTPSSEREAEILARVDYLDAKKKVAIADGDDASEIQAELDALCVEWDAARKPSA